MRVLSKNGSILIKQILCQISQDLSASTDRLFGEEETSMREDMTKLSNRAMLSQLGRVMSDSEVEEFQVKN